MIFTFVVVVTLMTLLGHDVNSAATESHVKFAWTSRAQFNREDNDVPYMNVTFANGVRDQLVLSRYDPGDDAFLELEGVTLENLDHCSFIGYLAGEPEESSAAVTGCPHHEDFEVTLFSKHSPKQILFSGSEGGAKIQALKSPLEEEGCKAEFIENENVRFESSAAVSNRQAIPSTMTMNIVLVFDRNLSARRGGNANTANYLRNVITQAQASFFHPSLGTRVTLRVVRVLLDSNRIFSATSTQLNSIANGGGITRETNVHVSSLWGANQGSGTIGIAFIATVCGDTRRRIQINEDQNSASRNGILFAHETGHNLNMRHDEDGGCFPTGIMGARLGTSRTWTSCSRNGFFTYIRAAIRQTGRFCMATGSSPPAPTPAPTPSPSCFDRSSICPRITFWCTRSSAIRFFWCRRSCRVCR